MLDWSGEASLAALFASAFLSATVLPGNSEVVLFAVLRAFPSEFAAALALATVGNTLGSMTTYGLGRLVPGRAVAGSTREWVRRYGAFALLFAWVPVAGDALTGREAREVRARVLDLTRRGLPPHRLFASVEAVLVRAVPFDASLDAGYRA